MRLRLAVAVAARIPERFQCLRLRVNLTPIESQHAREKEFDQTMSSNHPPRFPDARWSQLGSSARFVIDPTAIRQALEHACNRRRANLQTSSNVDR